MGFFDLFGTTFSGWRTDRFDPRKLLFFYYGLRGLSLIYLPYSDFSLVSRSVFAVFYGLDWLATVPPTVRIANEAFGDKNAPLVFGWVVAGHQLGAACAAFFAGFVRSAQGDYLQAFMIAGATGIVAAVLVADDRPASATGAPLPDSFSVMESGFRQQQRLGSTTSDSRRSRR
jgi:predicted MFS family arabinose efflux permease